MHRPRISPGTRFPILLTVGALSAIAALTPASAVGQDLGSIQGAVLDEVDGQPLDDAKVSIVELDDRVETDDAGLFQLSGLPVGSVTLRVEKPGYGTVVEQVEVRRAGGPVFEVRLPRMENMLRELLVRGRSASGSPDYSVRRREQHKTAADLLSSDVPGVQVIRGSGGVGSGSQIRIRGIKSITGSNDPLVYLDGIRIDSQGRTDPSGNGHVLNVLETIPAAQVERIRVLSGPAAASQFQNAANGVILVETVRGGSSASRDDDDEG